MVGLLEEKYHANGTADMMIVFLLEVSFDFADFSPPLLLIMWVSSANSRNMIYNLSPAIEVIEPTIMLHFQNASGVLSQNLPHMHVIG